MDHLEGKLFKLTKAIGYLGNHLKFELKKKRDIKK
jgi:hypothetical protein